MPVRRSKGAAPEAFDGKVVLLVILQASECIACLIPDIDAGGVRTAGLPVVELITSQYGFYVRIPGQCGLAGLGLQCA